MAQQVTEDPTKTVEGCGDDTRSETGTTNQDEKTGISEQPVNRRANTTSTKNALNQNGAKCCSLFPNTLNCFGTNFDEAKEDPRSENDDCGNKAESAKLRKKDEMHYSDDNREDLKYRCYYKKPLYPQKKQ